MINSFKKVNPHTLRGVEAKPRGIRKGVGINISAWIILLTMFLLMLGSARNDSATMDELAHIPAGFGYIKELDFRLNPEHPPLLKVLAALSGQIFARPHTITGKDCIGVVGNLQCLFGVGASPYFPTNTTYWQNDVNGQWAQGAIFLYESGNDADKIIFWSRLPMILLTVFFAWLVYYYTRKRFGNSAAILTLLFFAFSPTILTHGKYVTTDIGAAFGFFIGIIFFIKFLEIPTGRNLLIAGAIFGIAQLLKFSLVLLIPMYIMLLLVWVWTKPNLHLHERIRVLWKMGLKTLLIGVIGFALVWAVYGVFTRNYPQGQQLRDADFLLSSYGFRPVVDLNLELIKNKFTRPLGEYFLGFLMVSQRSTGGNTAFFLGEVSATGSRLYFPLLYIVKETLALHILTIIAIWFGVWKIRKSNFQGKFDLERLRSWIQNHFVEFASLLFIAFYWGVSIKSPLNIGVRHVLPTFPFIYLLVGRQISEWLHSHSASDPQTWFEWLKNIYQIFIKALGRYFVVAVMMLWLAASTVSTYPNFMSYYNELAGGKEQGYKIAVDSNYDWGQDLRRLVEFVEKNKIEKIAVDYFGGGNPRYYLGDKFEPWWSSRGPASNWFAISATFRQGAFGKTAPGFIREPKDSYEWLKHYEPIARVGYSIFIYQLP